MSEKKPVIVAMEHKYTDDLVLTPEQLQAQQDFYDQWTAPTTEPVDFAAEQAAYLARQSIRVNNPVVSTDGDGNIVVTGEVDVEPRQHPEGSFGVGREPVEEIVFEQDPTLF